MTNDAKLQKVTLGPEWIDLSFGEPTVVTNALFKNLNRAGKPFIMPSFYDLLDWTYQPAAGSPDLVKVLEEKYRAKVVVCNGAKQALAAAMFAFKNQVGNKIFYDSPFYPANPSLAQSVGLTWASISEADSLLITSPNNPDGKNLSNVNLLDFKMQKPMIHDAAYYTPVYLPENQMDIPIGDIQVYSMSKMYGVSGLRIGYSVCHNEKYYSDMVNYVEMTTAGVSIVSQDIALSIELSFKENPDWYKQFVSDSRNAITLARKELLNLDPEVLIVEEPESHSMFAWCKIGPKLDHQSAKVYILPGELFGKPGYMRINIAHPPEVISEAVSRLNKFKIRS
jgi:aspartate/methionine/tyrosine aminotransferase